MCGFVSRTEGRLPSVPASHRQVPRAAQGRHAGLCILLPKCKLLWTDTRRFTLNYQGRHCASHALTKHLFQFSQGKKTEIRRVMHPCQVKMRVLIFSQLQSKSKALTWGRGISRTSSTKWNVASLHCSFFSFYYFKTSIILFNFSLILSFTVDCRYNSRNMRLIFLDVYVFMFGYRLLLGKYKANVKVHSHTHALTK